MAAVIAGCSTLLPRSKSLTDSPWQSFEEAQRAFEQIVPHKTTVADLKLMKLDPDSNSNIAILNYSDVLRRSRYGNFWADVFNLKRKVDMVGWRFNAVVLITDDLVVYKLTGGQPAIHEHEESDAPLGPLRGAGEAIFRWSSPPG